MPIVPRRPRALLRNASLLLCVAAALSACPSGDHPDVSADVPATPEAGMDVPGDDGAPPDVGTDARDAGDVVDAAPPDAAMDAPMDAPADVPSDVPVDAPAMDAPSRDVPLAGDGATCFDRTLFVLEPDSAYTRTLTGTATDAGVAPASCQGAANATYDVYRMHLGARTGLVLSTDGSLTGIDTVLSLRDACDAGATELACNDDHGTRTTSRVRAVLPAGDYYVLMGEYGASSGGGAYQIQSSSFVPAANATCATASALTRGAPLAMQRLDGAGAPSAQCRPGAAGPQLFYTLMVPASGSVTVTATPAAGSTFRPVLRVLPSGCGATDGCLVSAVAASAGAAVSLDVSAAADGGASSVVVSVSSAEEVPAAGSAFTLSAM